MCDEEVFDTLEELIERNYISEDQINWIITLAESPDYEIRAAVCKALRIHGSKTTVDVLGKLLQDNEPLVRCEACEALGNIDSQQVSHLLFSATEDPNNLVRGYAALNLANMAQHNPACYNDAVEKVSIMLNHEHDAWTIIAITGSLLILEYPKHYDELISLFEDTDYRNRCFVLNLLADLAEQGKVPNPKVLKSWLIEKKEEELSYAVQSSIAHLIHVLQSSGISDLSLTLPDKENDK